MSSAGRDERMGSTEASNKRIRKKGRKKNAVVENQCLTSKAPYKAQAAETVRLKVPMRRLGADCFVVVLKRV